MLCFHSLFFPILGIFNVWHHWILTFECWNTDSLTPFFKFRYFPSFAILNIQIWIYKLRLTLSIFWFYGLSMFGIIEYWNLNIQIKCHSLFFLFQGFSKFCNIEFCNLNVEIQTHSFFSNFRDFPSFAILNNQIWIYKLRLTHYFFSNLRDFPCLA